MAAVRIIGTDKLQRRLAAIGQTFKPIGQKWTRNTRDVARVHTPVRTGRLRKSYRIETRTRGNPITYGRSIVRAHYTAYFVDAGPVAHTITPKGGRYLRFEKNGHTVFARKVNHPGYGARPYRQLSASEGLRRTDMSGELIGLWNGAA